jgi:hypothetical protein
MTSERIRSAAAAGVLAGVLAISGCGSDEGAAADAGATATPVPTPTSTPAVALPTALRGHWQRTMTARDWRTAGRGYPLGTWRFDVSKNGAVDVYLPRTSEVDFSTEFEANGKTLTIENVPVCPDEPGKYAWHAAGKKLTLTVVDDTACKARGALFGGTWTRR